MPRTNARRMAALLQAAKRDANSRYRETYRLPSGATVLCESESERDFWSGFSDALEGGDLRPEEFSIRDLFENFIEGGREIVDSWNPRHGGGGINLALLEAADAVSTAAFSNISGQIFYTKVMERFEDEAFVFSAAIPDQQTEFNGERIPGITPIGDKNEVVEERQPFPMVGVGEDWIDTPQTQKRGAISGLTKEALFFDRTGLLIKEASDLGFWLGLNKERRAVDCVVDENETRHRYKWKGTTYATYQDTSPWVNVKGSNDLVDWTDIDAAEQVMAAIRDPNTGEPIMVLPKDIIVTRSHLYAAKRIISATEITVTTPGYATSGAPTETRVPNPISNYRILSSQLLASRMSTKTHWFLGDVARAFVYMQNWPMTVVQSPPNSAREFERDIVMEWKVSERGTFATIEPRVMVKSTVA